MKTKVVVGKCDHTLKISVEDMVVGSVFCGINGDIAMKIDSEAIKDEENIVFLSGEDQGTIYEYSGNYYVLPEIRIGIPEGEKE